MVSIFSIKSSLFFGFGGVFALKKAASQHESTKTQSNGTEKTQQKQLSLVYNALQV
jgi:hypothetical protein